MNVEAALKTLGRHRRREGQLALTGLELKEQGIASVSRHPWVEEARRWAESYCRATGTVTSDWVHFIMDVDYPPHPNCYGAIFHDKRFRATGERVRSTRPEAHGRWIEVWRLA
ncbi:hypothetical protein LCGC14_2551240 [marine sediment metagenome]|uniref:Uncharacterized protein n=1 Tax=marine sediment metagenome TaxID=412755 RepID=A0A0F9DFX2_9ZZZZ